jgi:hypothetical protein
MPASTLAKSRIKSLISSAARRYGAVAVLADPLVVVRPQKAGVGRDRAQGTRRDAATGSVRKRNG